MASNRIGRRTFIKRTAAGTAGLAAGTAGVGSHRAYGRRRRSGAARKKVIVLGIDGMDPVILGRMADSGLMPNFSKLIETGSFRKLGTSIPPQSPVAWANFINGTHPGGHGIYDFIHREPDTLIPYLSTSGMDPPKWPIQLGKYRFPLVGGKAKLLRRGVPFWSVLDEHDVPATLIKIPSNFPPTEFSGRSLSGLGTPDLLGTYGLYTYYTDHVPDNADDMTGGRAVEVRVVDNVVRSTLSGPDNTFVEGEPAATLDVTVYVDPVSGAAEIVIGGNRLVLKQGEWSDWLRVKFEMVPHLASVSAICHVYLKEITPHFKMYISALHIDPVDPALPICTPKDYSNELVDAIGLYETKGLPTDTKALMEGTFDDGEYAVQSEMILAKRCKMYEYELDRFDDGFLFCYFCNLDLDQHVFWRTHDKRHPAYTEQAGKFSQAVPNLYRRFDDVLGMTMDAVDEQTAVYVISDHGFAPYYNSFNLNSWLEQEGYVRLTSQHDRESTEFFETVDWSRTRAYGLGLNGLYVNVAGREPNGSVPSRKKDALEDELANKLLALRDPETGDRVIGHVYKSSETFHGPYTDTAPDLIVGYARGYRAGWDTILGGFPREVIVPNTEAWSGDHCVDPPAVPGTLVANRLGAIENPGLHDMAPTILAEFGLDVPDEMDGRPIIETG